MKTLPDTTHIKTNGDYTLYMICRNIVKYREEGNEEFYTMYEEALYLHAIGIMKHQREKRAKELEASKHNYNLNEV